MKSCFWESIERYLIVNDIQDNFNLGKVSVIYKTILRLSQEFNTQNLKIDFFQCRVDISYLLTFAMLLCRHIHVMQALNSQVKQSHGIWY